MTRRLCQALRAATRSPLFGQSSSARRRTPEPRLHRYIRSLRKQSYSAMRGRRSDRRLPHDLGRFRRTPIHCFELDMSDELLLAQPEPPLATGMFGEGAIDSLPGPVVNALIGCIRGLGLPPRLASAYLI